MSDLSHRFCKKCRQPEYACECDDGDMVDSVINIIARGEQPQDDHPFFDRHANRFIK